MSTRATTRSQAKSTGGTRKSEAWIPPATAPIDARKTLPILIIGIVLLTTTIFVFIKYHRDLIRVPRLTKDIDRLVHALQLNTFALLPLFISLASVMFARIYHGAFNPLRGDDQKFVVLSRILTNSVEHTVFFIINHLIFATFVNADQYHLVVLATILFTLGRILFFIGYNFHPKYRSIGFVISFIPTALIFLWNLGQATGINKSLPAVPKLEL